MTVDPALAERLSREGDEPEPLFDLALASTEQANDEEVAR